MPLSRLSLPPAAPDPRSDAPESDRLRAENAALQAENAVLRADLARARARAGADRRAAADRLAAVERALQQSLRDRQSILDHMPALIGCWDRDCRNRFANHAYREWFGLDPAAIAGRHIREVIGETRYRLNLPYIEAVLRGEPQTFERDILLPDGITVRHSLAHYIPDRVDREVRGFYVLVFDISDLKITERALRASEERFRAVLEDQTEVISRLLPDGTFLFVNEVYCRFFGQEPERLIGSRWQPVAHPDDLPMVEARLRTLAPDNPVVVIENRVCGGDGALRWLQFVNRGFFDAEGRLLEIQSVGRDITRLKEAEQALREANEGLERRVAERTEQLRRLASEMTHAEERERHAIARDLHDDLGQLLHVVKLRLDLLARLPLADAARTLVAETDALVVAASRQVRSLTSQLNPPVLATMGLAAALRWLAGEVEEQWGLTVDCAVEAEPRPLPATSAAILFRAARELLINVARHSGTRTATLTFRCDDGFLRLAVGDAGGGRRAVESALAGNGFGFGLPSVRERITFLGGTLVLGDGPGVTVEISLPLSSPSGEARP